jgi:ketosteroid isomerase-like protein
MGEREENLATARYIVERTLERDLIADIRRVEAGDESVLADAADVFEKISPDVVWDTRGMGLTGFGVFEGHAGVVEFWQQWLEMWAEWEFDITDMATVADDVIVYTTHVRGTSLGAGVPAELTQHHRFRLRDGKLVHFSLFGDRAEAESAETPEAG